MSVYELTSHWSSLWVPPQRLSLSEWAEQYFILSSDYSARSGPIKLFPYQRAVFDAFTDDSIEEIVLLCSTQMLKTIFIQCAIAYGIVSAPGPMLLVEPKQDDAKAFSKERIGPMLRDIPCLKGVTEGTSKTNQDTILQKDFNGGSLAMAGGIAPGNLARRSIRYLFVDETDKLPVSAGNEGDPIALARERTVTFGSRRKIVLCCSPTTEQGRISQAYEASDKRQPFVPCATCGAFQTLNWDHVEWDNKLPIEQRPATAYYECQVCGAHWDDLDRWAACERLEWRAQKPFAGKAGFMISHLYSPFKTLGSMVEDYLTAKHSHSTQRVQVFYNTTLALPWRELGQAPQEEILFAQREKYAAEVPQRCLFLTAGCDVQPDRLEVEVVGWGRNGESYSIAYEVIEALDQHGNRLSVQSAEVWEKLDALLKRQWVHESGFNIQIWCIAIDTGSLPQPVYQFCFSHPQPAYGATGNIRVHSYGSTIPVKGSADDIKVLSSVSNEDAARKRRGLKIVGVGTNAVKTQLFDSLRFVKPQKDTPTPNACHFPDEYSLEYFRGLCSEERIVTDGGKVHFQKKGAQRNEPLDCRVYAIAAATVCGLGRFQERHWQDFESRLNIQADLPAIPAPSPTQPTARRGEWIGRHKDWLR